MLGQIIFEQLIIDLFWQQQYLYLLKYPLALLRVFLLYQEKSNKKTGPRTVDFFCGAGGLSLGFSQEGFQVDLANDYEDVCIETFRYNHPEVPGDRVILGDIRNIVDHIEDYINDEIDPKDEKKHEEHWRKQMQEAMKGKGKERI